jgi:hypothetical protein
MQHIRKEGKSIEGFDGEIQRREMPGSYIYRWDDNTETNPRDRIGGHRLN